MTQKSMSYDHPAYLARNCAQLGLTAAGAGATTEKFIACQANTIYSVMCTVVASGTSTYGPGWNGTATVAKAVGAQTFSVIRVLNTAAPGATPALSTATYGPFISSLFDGTLTNTQTNSSKPGYSNYVQLSGTATTGTAQAGAAAADGGIQVNAGDQVYVVQGTDATFTAVYSLEFSITPLASITN